MMKKLTQKQVVLVAEEINNTVELLAKSRRDPYKFGGLHAHIDSLTKLLTEGYDDCWTFDERFTLIQNHILDTFHEVSPM